MPYIKWIDPEEATGEVAEFYRTCSAADIMRCMSLRPDFGKLIAEAAMRLHFSDGALSRREHEAIATYVSGVNQCPF
jgi:hypothetical protein